MPPIPSPPGRTLRAVERLTLRSDIGDVVIEAPLGTVTINGLPISGGIAFDVENVGDSLSIAWVG